MENAILSLLIFWPILGALLILLLPNAFRGRFKWIATGFLTVEALLCVVMASYFQYGPGAPSGVVGLSSFQMVAQYDWITLQLGHFGWLSIDYLVGIDGVNFPMVMLSGIVLLIGAIASFEIKVKEKGYFALYLLLAGTIMGSFLALDFFLFFLFFEFMLLPMYFLIGIWGGTRREYASLKFFLYTLLGSVFILVVMIALYGSVIDPGESAVRMGVATTAQKAGQGIIEQIQSMVMSGVLPKEAQVHTFNMLHLMNEANYLPDSLLSPDAQHTLLGYPARMAAFILLFIGLAIKLPIVPLHTWLPDAHVEAPTPISVILAGLLLKIGGYGLIRLGYGIFPLEAVESSWWIGLIGVISILYAAFVALGTRHLKKIIAYSSVSHMGFVLLGLASATHEGIGGAMFQLFSHGLISPLLFLLAGVLYSRTHHLQTDDYRGLLQRMPQYGGFVAIAFFAALGLPGFSGFVAEIFVLLGAFSSDHLPHWMPILAALGLVIGAAYYLWTYQRMFMGEFSIKQPALEEQLTPMSYREYGLIAVLTAGTLLLGIFPSILLDRMSNAISTLAIWLAN